MHHLMHFFQKLIHKSSSALPSTPPASPISPASSTSTPTSILSTAPDPQPLSETLVQPARMTMAIQRGRSISAGEGTTGTLKRVLSIQNRRKKERGILLSEQLMAVYPASSDGINVDDEEEERKEDSPADETNEQSSPVLESPLPIADPAVEQGATKRHRPLTPTVSTISLEEMEYNFRSFLRIPAELVYVGPLVRRDMPIVTGNEGGGRVVGRGRGEEGRGRRSWESADSGRFTNLDVEPSSIQRRSFPTAATAQRIKLLPSRTLFPHSDLSLPLSTPRDSSLLTPASSTIESSRFSSAYSEPSVRDDISVEEEIVCCSSRFSDCTTTTGENRDGDDEGEDEEEEEEEEEGGEGEF